MSKRHRPCPDERAKQKLDRAAMLVGLLEDLPRESESTAIVHDEILRARLEADYARRLAERDVP